MQIIERYTVNNPCYKNNINKVDSRYTLFQNRGPQGLMLHSVGCAQPSATVFVNQWNTTVTSVAVHAVLQADGTVYQCLPWNFRGWHGGGSSNNTHIGVEMTEPSQIKYSGGATFTVLDKAAATAQVKGTYETAVQLFAFLCKKYNLNPMTQICSHAEGYKKGIATNHGDPEHLWRGLGLSYTMDGFRKDVKKCMDGEYYTTMYAIGWTKDEKGWYYSPDGISYYNHQWKKIDDNWYYFGNDGYILQNTSWEYNNVVYTADESGHVTWREMPQEENAEREGAVIYYYLREVPDYYRETLDKLIASGAIKGRSGEGEDLIIDMTEDMVRVLVILDRKGVFG